jgi:purine-cytosine permease-like protein
MPIILNSPPPIEPPKPPPVADRAWLERADKTLRSVRVLVILVCILVTTVAVIGAKASDGMSLAAIPGAIAFGLVCEVVIISARSLVATAWSAREPATSPAHASNLPPAGGT